MSPQRFALLPSWDKCVPCFDTRIQGSYKTSRPLPCDPCLSWEAQSGSPRTETPWWLSPRTLRPATIQPIVTTFTDRVHVTLFWTGDDSSSQKKIVHRVQLLSLLYLRSLQPDMNQIAELPARMSFSLLQRAGVMEGCMYVAMCMSSSRACWSAGVWKHRPPSLEGSQHSCHNPMLLCRARRRRLPCSAAPPPCLELCAFHSQALSDITPPRTRTQ